MSNCRVCGKPLNESQWKEERSYKSCPKCSVENSKEHVYYEYPEHFGTTDARITATNPDGAQSYCAVCRNRAKVHGTERLCSEF